MSWRTVVITKHVKLSYKNSYLIVRGEQEQMIHLSEIHTLLIDTTRAVLTAYLISELMKQKIKVIFCDEKRQPESEIVPYYGAHNTSKKIKAQLAWSISAQQEIWTAVIAEKIQQQQRLLNKLGLPAAQKLKKYLADLQLYDVTNREGHAAKVYFNALFGKDFVRESDDTINIALNYGYTILLSTFNKEIVSQGYLTQIGLKHTNQFNYFNLSSDLMEPFRPMVDALVYNNMNDTFDTAYKLQLVNLLNEQVIIQGQKHFVTMAIHLYLKSVFKALDEGNPQLIKSLEVAQ
ncbi:type II CRISPR-associated endonuclease Cas1 [Brochothrix thermosphacta]|uniref:CRISPR-associated endonuclease Cas1 n=1 Tax=Brochothrix thermosphacta TaxID=2756 RepID=A0A1D2LUP2_BROTH|nr:type II CRISPR-associated endonuclease Cas1 [Brochothrix thermosphacta]ATF27137.1 type II CRISPR-associated endonuclease Cas1 [Brochothrix thermosphacta]ATH86496.1 type II CRISPR-associated endonuclease Cas1 [Brochothrix thermosphacta]MPQ28074.1 type II CRISPR-associated endonuclease Cas1 [Brochothrix thermosphacta]ODJ66902.1 subtype II CRISPR-associated endonuclease Cas1 [Brochothrix thermosphacta]ODJ73471.1 subtype II CRISPR-associated endonuclease Cas1 [Brochothrix thermosphacta]